MLVLILGLLINILNFIKLTNESMCNNIKNLKSIKCPIKDNCKCKFKN